MGLSANISENTFWISIKFGIGGSTKDASGDFIFVLIGHLYMKHKLSFIKFLVNGTLFKK